MISIIIRTYNEEAYIGECLKRVFSQEITEKFEVIIVDSESTDNTLKIAKSFDVNIHTIKKSEFSYGKALNMGCEKANGEICVFLSAHAWPKDSHWLKNLISPLIQRNITATFSRHVPHKNADPLEERHILLHWSSDKYVLRRKSAFNNAASAIKKSVFNDIKFDEVIPCAEDILWAKKVISLGMEIKYIPSSVIIHSHSESLKRYRQRIQRELQSYHIIGFPTVSKSLPFYNFLLDSLHVVKNGYSLRWIKYSWLRNKILYKEIIQYGKN